MFVVIGERAGAVALGARRAIGVFLAGAAAATDALTMQREYR